jgi:hypothetical protein
MEQNKKIYLYLAIVFIASFMAAFLLPISEFFKGISSIPLAGTLIGALYQIFRDQAEHEKQLELQRKKQFFDLAVTSHMANTAFNKHVDFCESYMKKVHLAFLNLISDGPSRHALKDANELYKLRVAFEPWVTDEISIQLDRFESALRHLGAKAGYAESTRSDPNETASSQKTYIEAHGLWENLLAELLKKEVDSITNPTVEKTKAKIREILGIEELTLIRKWVISQAVKSIETDA